MTCPQKRNPGEQAGASGNVASGRGFHVDHASAEPLLQRLEGVQRFGNSWRARCPACGGRSRKLSITEAEGRVLLHCFDCGDAGAVLAAVGLCWADLYPPRHWPLSREEQRVVSRAMREASWGAALSVLALESKIVQLAAYTVAITGPLPPDDYTRLLLACERIDGAANVLVEARA